MVMQHIVVGVDGSENSERALRWAIDEARVHGATVTVVHAWSVMPPGGVLPIKMSAPDLRIFEDRAKRLAEEALHAVATKDVDIEARAVCGGAADALIKAAKGANLLVVGSRGHGGFAQLLLGSVSQQVSHHSPCPVVIVPGASAA